MDLVFHPADGPIGDEHFARATEMAVARTARSSRRSTMLVAKLLAINEQEPDFRAVLEISGAVREQVNWKSVARRTKSSPPRASSPWPRA